MNYFQNRKTSDYFVLSNSLAQDRRFGQALVQKRAPLHRHRRQQRRSNRRRPPTSWWLKSFFFWKHLFKVVLIFLLFESGLCGCSVREAISLVVLVLEKVSQKKGHGVFQLVHVGQISSRVAQLHRLASHVHSRKRLFIIIIIIILFSTKIWKLNYQSFEFLVFTY